MNLKTINLSRIFNFLLLSLGMLSQSGAIYAQVDASKIVLQAEELIKNLGPNLLDNLDEKVNVVIRALEEKEAAALAKDLLEIRDQNTIIWPEIRHNDFYNNPGLALHKGDIARGLCWGINFAGHAYLFAKLQSSRIDNIYDQIINNLDEVIGLEEKNKAANEKSEEDFRQKNFFSKMFSSLNIDKTITEYIQENHNYISYNPFKTDLALPIAVNVVLSKLSTNLLKKLLNYNETHNFERNSLSYYKTPDNEYHHIEGVLSMVSYLNWYMPYLNEPSTFPFREMFGVKAINEMLDLGVPKFLFSETADKVSDIASYGLMIKNFNGYFQTGWSTYMLQNKEELFELCKNLKNQINLQADLQEAKDKIKEFVSKGHTLSPQSKLFMPGTLAWMRVNANVKVNLIRYLPVISVMAYKGLKMLNS